MGKAVFDRPRVPVTPVVTDAVAGADVTAAPVGGLPVTVAVSLMNPLSRSAWVTA